MNSAANMSTRIGTKTYSKKPECKSSLQFDHLLADKGNKPSTAKVSVAAVHRWGMTSFTSLRKTHLNGQKEVPVENEDRRVKRVKIEPKNSSTDDPFSFESDIDSSVGKHSFSSHSSSPVSRGAPFLVDVKPAIPKPNKFFKSGSSRLLVAGQNVQRQSDFDTLRLSVSTNSCSRVKSDDVIHQLNRYSPQNNLTFQMDNSAISFKSATSSDGVHFNSCAVNTSKSTCASTNFLTSTESDFYRNPSKVNSPTNMFKENIRTAPASANQCSPILSAEEFLRMHKPRIKSNSSHISDPYRTSDSRSCINARASYNANDHNVKTVVSKEKDLIDYLDEQRDIHHRHDILDMIDEDSLERVVTEDNINTDQENFIDLIDDESLSSRLEEGSPAQERSRDLRLEVNQFEERRRDLLDIIEEDETFNFRGSVQSRSDGHRDLLDVTDIHHETLQDKNSCEDSEIYGQHSLVSGDVGGINHSKKSHLVESPIQHQRDEIDVIEIENEIHKKTFVDDKRHLKHSDTESFLYQASRRYDDDSGSDVKLGKRSATYPTDSEHKVAQQQLRRTKKIFSSSKKNKAVYNHRHWQATKDPEQLAEKEPDVGDSGSGLFEDEIDNEEPPPSFLVRKVVSCKVKETEEHDPLLQEEVSMKKCGNYKYEFKNMGIHETYVYELIFWKTNSIIRVIQGDVTILQLLVIKNVKQAYQCHESGETQEFNDDIEYLLECIQVSNVIGTRCLSVLSLAAKCMGPAFRIHLRAHGTMPKIFSALKDAPSDPNLSLCTATLLFVLSQDRLSMDLDGSTLSLMLKLLESDPGVGSKERELELILEDPALCAMQEKHREKVYQLCEQMQQKGHAKHLKLDNVNTGILAMETLLSLTSRKTGEWFKTSIRTLHGLDHIVNTVTSCVSQLIPEEEEIIANPNETQLDKIRKIDRCLRVLENVSYMNVENQIYLLQFKDSLLIESLLSLLKLFETHLMANPLSTVDICPDDATESSGKADEPQATNAEESAVKDTSDGNEVSSKGEKKESEILNCLLSLLKVILNITHENQFGRCTVGSTDGLIEIVMRCILQLPRAVPSDKRFDVLVLSLGILINLVEHSYANAKQIVNMCVPGSFDTVYDGFILPSVEALIGVLISRLEAARQSEEQADALLSSQEERNIAAAVVQKDAADNGNSQADDLEETLMKTLQKAKKHMEHSIVAAYISLLLGCIIENNKDYASIMKDHLPDGKLDVMADVLQKFHSFVSLTNVVGNTGLKSLERVLKVLQSS